MRASVAVVLCCFIAVVFSQTTTINPTPIISCTAGVGGACTPWSFNSTINAWDSGDNLNRHSLENILEYQIVVPTTQYLQFSLEYQVSSEPDFDVLYVDADKTHIAGPFSGENGAWTPLSIANRYLWTPYTPGNHSIQFRYIKDSAKQMNRDRVYVRNLVFGLTELRCSNVGVGEPNVCSGRSACTPTASPGVGQCSCPNNYYAADCSYPLQCNGMFSIDNN